MNAIPAEERAAIAQATDTGRLARFAVGALVLTFIVVVASAYMRHVQSVGCSDWPSCYGRIASEAQAAAPSIGVHLARILHRLAASAALLSIVMLLLFSWRRSDLRRPRSLTLSALAAALALAALGVATPGATLPAVSLGNLLGGFVMLALLAGLCGALMDDLPAGGAPLPQRVSGVTLLTALFVQTCLGGLIGTQFALPACPALDGCIAPGDLGAALHPFQAPVIVDGRIVPPSGAGSLHLVHRALGIAIAIGTLAFACVLRSKARGAAALLAALAVIAPLTGALAILHMPAMVTTVAHNAVTAGLIVVVARYALAGAARRS